MFNNIGRKIKGLATVIAVLGICGSFICGMTIMEKAEIDESFAIYGLAVIIVGLIFSWISCFVLYGLGELIENSAKANRELTEIKRAILILSNNQKNSRDSRTEDVNVTGNFEKVSYCDKCGEKITAYPCEHCGNQEETNKRIPVNVYPNEYGYITCPICKMVQAGSAQKCSQCGQLFINKQPDMEK